LLSVFASVFVSAFVSPEDSFFVSVFDSDWPFEAEAAGEWAFLA